MKLRATQPFTHESRQFQPGDIVQASSAAGKWLIAQGVAEEIAEQPKAEKSEKHKA